MEEMNCLKTMDKVTFGVMNESAGCIEKRTQSSLEIIVLRWPNLSRPGEGSTLLRTVTNTRRMHRRGISDDMLTNGLMQQLQTPSSPRQKKDCRKLGKRYNPSQTEKFSDGERVSDRVVVVKEVPVMGMERRTLALGTFSNKK